MIVIVCVCLCVCVIVIVSVCCAAKTTGTKWQLVHIGTLREKLAQDMMPAGSVLCVVVLVTFLTHLLQICVCVLCDRSPLVCRRW